jgi:hypothetical protein
LGNDTLIAGSGAGDTLIAGAGVDTLEGGTGGDAFIAAGAYGTFFAATGLGGSVDLRPEPPRGGLGHPGPGHGQQPRSQRRHHRRFSISGIQTLITGSTAYGFTRRRRCRRASSSDTSITLTNAQWNGFSALTDIALGTDGSFTINAANDNAEMLGVLLRRAA